MTYFFWGYVRPDNADIEEIIADPVKHNLGTRAVNIQMEFKQTFLKKSLGAITIGIYVPSTLQIEGDVVK